MDAQIFLTREQEVARAIKEFPELEMGEAYARWKRIRGEEPALRLNTADKTLKETKKDILKTAQRPCTQPRCKGTMFLESICGGCVEGRAGYKSKWTCDNPECLHRELSKREFMEWLQELSLQSKPLSLSTPAPGQPGSGGFLSQFGRKLKGLISSDDF